MEESNLRAICVSGSFVSLPYCLAHIILRTLKATVSLYRLQTSLYRAVRSSATQPQCERACSPRESLLPSARLPFPLRKENVLLVLLVDDG